MHDFPRAADSLVDRNTTNKRGNDNAFTPWDWRKAQDGKIAFEIPLLFCKEWNTTILTVKTTILSATLCFLHPRLCLHEGILSSHFQPI